MFRGVGKLRHWLHKRRLNKSAERPAVGTASQAAADKREHQRIPLSPFPRAWVLLSDSKTRLGCLVDISLGGFRLVSEQRIASKKTYAVQMEIPITASYISKINFQACSAWCRLQPDHDVFDTGFAYVNLSPELRKRIEQIVSVLGQPVELRRNLGDQIADDELKALLDSL